MLIFSIGILVVGRDWLQLPPLQLQTWSLYIRFYRSGHGYLVRQRGHFWNSRPSKWLLLSSVADIAVVSVLATRGILMEAIRPQLVFTILIACVCYLAVTDLVKVSLLRRLPTGL